MKRKGGVATTCLATIKPILREDEPIPIKEGYNERRVLLISLV